MSTEQNKVILELIKLGILPTGNYLDGYGKDVCGFCGLSRTDEGHDGCIGTLDNTINACCGHGETKTAYVQFKDKERISGKKALEYIVKSKKE